MRAKEAESGFQYAALLRSELDVGYTSWALQFEAPVANVAQLVEQRIRNAWVAGSSPAVGSTETAGHRVTPVAFFVVVAIEWGVLTRLCPVALLRRFHV